jgi:hypothetical protein
VAVNSIYASIIPSYKYNLVLKSFSYGTQVMGHPVFGSTISEIILSLVIQREGTKLPEIFDLIIRVFVSTTISTSERSERVEIV